MPSIASRPHRINIRRHRTNRFDGAIRGESRWHTHAGGQFILAESGISHLNTELGAWIIPTRRVGWIPPGVRHASRAGGSGRGWVIHAPAEFAKKLPRAVCVLRASALMLASLERLIRLAPGDGRMRCLLWRVVAAEMSEAQPERLQVPMPASPRISKAVQGVLDSPNRAMNLDELAARAGMSRRSFTRHFRSETGVSFSRWLCTVIAHHALERIASGHKVSSVAFDVGYESVSAFIAMIRRRYGASPRELLGERSAQYLTLAKP